MGEETEALVSLCCRSVAPNKILLPLNFSTSTTLSQFSFFLPVPPQLAGDVIASFSSADVFHRLTYILQQRPPTSDTAFAAVYALKQLVSMRPQPAR